MFGTGTAATITQVGNIRLLDKSSKSSSPSPLSLLSSALCLDCHPNPYHHHHHHQLIWFPNPLAPGSDIQIQIQQLENQTDSMLTGCYQWWLITVVMTSSEHKVHWCFQGFAGRTIGSPAQPLDWPPLFSPSSPISPGGDKQTKRADKVNIAKGTTDPRVEFISQVLTHILIKSNFKISIKSNFNSIKH